MKEEILRLVAANNGIKGVDLAMKLMSELGIHKVEHAEFLKILDEMVERGEIIEFEYYSSDMDYRAKFIYFTSDTIFANRGDSANSNQSLLDGESKGNT